MQTGYNAAALIQASRHIKFFLYGYKKCYKIPILLIKLELQQN